MTEEERMIRDAYSILSSQRNGDKPNAFRVNWFLSDAARYLTERHIRENSTEIQKRAA